MQELRRSSALVTLVVALAGTAAAPRAQAPDRGVEVPLRVVDRRGEPVVDLVPTDLEVAVDGQPIPADRLTLRRATGGHSRRLVFAVHQPSLDPADARAIVESLTALVGQLPAGERVAVWALPARAAQLLFTSEPTPVGILLGRLRGTRAQAGRYGLSLAQATAIAAGNTSLLDAVAELECARSGAMPGQGGQLDSSAPDRVRCRDDIARDAAGQVEEARAATVSLLQELRPLVDTLGRLDGPKHLALVTGIVGPADGELDAQLRALALDATTTGTVVHAIQVSRAGAESSRAAVAGIEREPAGLALGRETGGLALAATDARRAIGRLGVALQQDVALVLALRPGERDGAPHSLRIRYTRAGTYRVEAPSRVRFASVPASPDAGPAAAPAATPGMTASSGMSPPAVPDTVSVAPLASAPGGAAPLHVPPSTPDAPSLPGASPVAPSAPSLQELLTRAGAYVTRYSQVMPSAVLEEHYVQLGKSLFLPPAAPDLAGLAWRARDPTGGLNATIRERRQTRSDVMLVKLSDGRSTAFRDVFEANGRQLRGRDERLRKLFLEGSTDSVRQIRRIHEASAGWNLGGFYREINVPDLGLAVFDPRNASRFAYELGGVVAGIDAGPPCHEVRFLEVARPTLVRSTNIARPNVPLRGSACLEANGRIWRTRLDLDEHYTARGLIEVTFAPADRVPVLAPDRMWEWYQTHAARGPTGYGYVESLARYSNLRLFTVTTTEEVK